MSDSTSQDYLYSLPLVSTGQPNIPGPDHNSTAVLLKNLKHCHRAWHLYFNDRGFHNHATHQLFANYALGASGELLEETYKSHTAYLLPAKASPEAITTKNFFNHLEDHQYYSGYVAFFDDYLATHSYTEAIEHFIFSDEFNYGTTIESSPGGKAKPEYPEMLNRLLAGLFHPMIHVGYGIEFGVKGQLAEGLGHTAVHIKHQSSLVPPSLFKSANTSDDTLSKLISSFSISNGTNEIRASSPTPRPTLQIFHRILTDPRITTCVSELASVDLSKRYVHVIDNYGERIHELVSEWYEGWMKGSTSEADVERRLETMVEEVVVGCTLCFGVGGWAGRGDKNDAMSADFFLNHLVTSAVFLFPFLLPNTPSAFDPALSLSNRLLLLRTYLSTCLAWHISRGRPALPISAFYASPLTAKYLTAPPPAPSPDTSEPTMTLIMGVGRQDVGPQKAFKAGGNAWNRIVQSALVHPDEHLCKTQRALAEFARRYGGRAPGYYGGSGGKKGNLDGVEKLDGTVFVRVAGLCGERLGWAYEGGELRNWDRDGFF